MTCHWYSNHYFLGRWNARCWITVRDVLVINSTFSELPYCSVHTNGKLDLEWFEMKPFILKFDVQALALRKKKPDPKDVLDYSFRNTVGRVRYRTHDRSIHSDHYTPLKMRIILISSMSFFRTLSFEKQLLAFLLASLSDWERLWLFS